jgi:hypothetical protein
MLVFVIARVRCWAVVAYVFVCVIGFFIGALPLSAQRVPIVHSVSVTHSRPRLPRSGLERSWLLPLHVPVSLEQISREVLVEEGKELDAGDCLFTARQLWQTGLFSQVRVRVDTVRGSKAEDGATVMLELRDRLTAAPYLAFASGGGVASMGVGLDAVNLGGVGVSLDATLRYRTVNDIGWEGSLSLMQYRLWFDPELRGTLHLTSNRLRSSQLLAFDVPLDRTNDWFAAGVRLFHAAGNDVLYRSTTSASLLLVEPSNARTTPFSSGGGEVHFTMFGRYWEQDFSMTLLGGWQGAVREAEALRRPLDNTAYVLGSIAVPITDEANHEYSRGLWEHEMERVPPAQRNLYASGFLARLTTGLVSPTLNRLEDSLGRRASTRFAFGAAIGGGGFVRGGTYLFATTELGWIGRENPSQLGWVNGEMNVKVAIPFFPRPLPSALPSVSQPSVSQHPPSPQRSRLPGDTAANFTSSTLPTPPTSADWPCVLAMQASLMAFGDGGTRNFSQMIVGGERFLRGYAANAFVGTGRWSWTAELRNIPIARVGDYALTGTVFWDAAGTWDYTKVFNVTWSLQQSGGQSFGAGLRLHYPSLVGGTGLLRLDIAYNTTAGRVGQIILSTQEAFSLFGALDRAAPPELWSEQRFVEQ